MILGVVIGEAKVHSCLQRVGDTSDYPLRLASVGKFANNVTAVLTGTTLEGVSIREFPSTNIRWCTDTASDTIPPIEMQRS